MKDGKTRHRARHPLRRQEIQEKHWAEILRTTCSGRSCCDGAGEGVEGPTCGPDQDPLWRCTEIFFLNSCSSLILLNDQEGNTNSKEKVSQGDRMEMDRIQITSHDSVWNECLCAPWVGDEVAKIAGWLPWGHAQGPALPWGLLSLRHDISSCTSQTRVLYSSTDGLLRHHFGH